MYIVYIIYIPLYHKSKVIIVVPTYLEVDSFALLSKNRFSVLHYIKCLKSPKHDIDLKFLECKVMLIVFLSLN
jgi:patatin-like phospholipase/acyl hydrolase